MFKFWILPLLTILLIYYIHNRYKIFLRRSCLILLMLYICANLLYSSRNQYSDATNYLDIGTYLSKLEDAPILDENINTAHYLNLKWWHVFSLANDSYIKGQWTMQIKLCICSLYLIYFLGLIMWFRSL